MIGQPRAMEEGSWEVEWFNEPSSGSSGEVKKSKGRGRQKKSLTLGSDSTLSVPVLSHTPIIELNLIT